MCTGCASRLRIIRRTHERLVALVGALADARTRGRTDAWLDAGGLKDLDALVIDTASANHPRSQAHVAAVAARGAPPAAREGESRRQLPKRNAAKRAVATAQLELAFH